MIKYRVLKSRFVLARREYALGDTFEARPSALLRRAVRDGDLDTVSEALPASPSKRPRKSEEG